MTYNVRSLRDDDGAVAAVVRAYAPDVLLVQEAPRFLRWRSKRAALARRCGLVVATADRTGGLCVMTSLSVDVLSTSFTLLPKTSGRHQRVVVAATVKCRGATWRVLSVHFSTDAAERLRHLPAIRSVLTADPDLPVVVAGDLNEAPAGPVFSELAATLQDCWAVAGNGDGLTSPAVSPVRRLDAILADASLEVVSCETVDGVDVAKASDHRPVFAVLAQSDAGGQQAT
jgi:endonuclease/exonuclease/phosphatase family metal-dependent hydrolase